MIESFKRINDLFHETLKPDFLSVVQAKRDGLAYDPLKDINAFPVVETYDTSKSSKIHFIAFRIDPASYLEVNETQIRVEHWDIYWDIYLRSLNASEVPDDFLLYLSELNYNLLERLSQNFQISNVERAEPDAAETFRTVSLGQAVTIFDG